MTDFENWPYPKKTSFILLELTKNKALCNKIIELYKKCAKNKPNDNDLAKILEEYNRTDALRAVDLDWKNSHIEINKVIWPNIDATNAIQLTNRPRGYFIIVNNVEKTFAEMEKEEKSNLVSDEYDKKFMESMLEVPRDEVYDASKNKLPPASGLRLETERFKDLMTQFNFEVLNWGGLSIAEMKEEIAMLKKEDLNDHEAIALLVVTHGQDEEILGSDACNLPYKLHFKKKFNTLTPEYEKMATKKIDNDRAPIKTIVELFKDDKFSKLYAKLLFFTCCRIKTEPVVKNTEPVQGQKTKVTETKSLAEFKDDNLIVCYTCLEGNLV